MTLSSVARVALPRPKGTRRSSRVTLAIAMHPRQLEELRARAKRASMSLQAYVVALLASDDEDLADEAWLRTAPQRRKLGRARTLSWLEEPKA